MDDAGINPAALLRRHVSGDWGDIHPEDDGLNEGALETGARILSVYSTADDPTGCGSSPRPTAAPPRSSVPRTTDIGMDICGKAPTSETGEYFRTCQGTGKVRPDATSYPFSAENVAEFRDFVAASGGFEIW
jgi:hypothetical protein